MVGAAGLALMAWADQPTPGRLALFYALFALGFGNHLSMVLLLPAFAVFLLMHRRAGAADPLRPADDAHGRRLSPPSARCNTPGIFAGLWAELEPPATFAEALAKFWFDVTKADWRETLVMSVSETGCNIGRRCTGSICASSSACQVSRWPRSASATCCGAGRGALLLLLLYAGQLGVRVDLQRRRRLHLLSAVALRRCAVAGAGVAAIVCVARRACRIARSPPLRARCCLVYPAWRGYDTLPAVDRSWDRRAEQLLDEITATAPVATDAVYRRRRELAGAERLRVLHARAQPGSRGLSPKSSSGWRRAIALPGSTDFVDANSEIGRDVVVTRACRREGAGPRRRGESQTKSSRESLDFSESA